MWELITAGAVLLVVLTVAWFVWYELPRTRKVPYVFKRLNAREQSQLYELGWSVDEVEACDQLVDVLKEHLSPKEENEHGAA
jgi:hypothetical protein